MAEKKNYGSSSHGKVASDDSKEQYDTEDSRIDLTLPLEKLNLGPRKKLLVLDLNGLLVHRVHARNPEKMPKTRRPDGRYGKFTVYKRPFSEEFMKFCFERFEVGIWSTAMEYNADAALNYAMGSLKSRLLFVWDQNHCSDSGFKSLENKNKPLFFKELKKLWEKVKKGGPYSASNTVLIDDTPYKALLNPPNTAIFPKSYNAEDKDDKALDPKSEMVLYLKGLADANDVQSYVKEHPFGQPAITSSHPHWDYYSNVLQSIPNK